MRIIAGTARGTTLRVARSPGLRPTGDRQRETLFNVIRDRVDGAAVLDLFAGSGGLGLEALSRGSRDCVFVEKSSRAATVLRGNAERCRLTDRSTVIVADWRAALRRLSGKPRRFDLIFADPPWADDEAAAWLQGAAAVAAPRALLCLERQRAAEVPANDAWEPFRVLTVGDTAFHLLERIVPADPGC
jgi:16S rRNA (guanine966-N2)-methyltransferase